MNELRPIGTEFAHWFRPELPYDPTKTNQPCHATKITYRVTEHCGDGEVFQPIKIERFRAVVIRDPTKDTWDWRLMTPEDTVNGTMPLLLYTHTPIDESNAIRLEG